jgi:hypothetical protein
MKAQLFVNFFGLLLTVQSVGAQPVDVPTSQVERPHLDLSIPRSSWQATGNKKVLEIGAGGTEKPQGMPYGSGYESRMRGGATPAQRSPSTGGRHGGRGR